MATQIVQAVIPSGANSVAVTPPAGYNLKAIQTPASFEGTTLTFDQGFASPGSRLYDSSTEYVVTSGANRYIVLSKPDLFNGPNYLKIISNVSGSPSNVAADRTLYLFFSS
jgi:hypothetical protein